MTPRMQVLAPAGTFVAVVATGVAVALLSGGSGGQAPPVLHLTGAARDAVAVGAPSAGEQAYRLTGTLPAGPPPDAPAWTLAAGPADADLVAGLATALQAGKPTRAGQDWQAGGLVVSGGSGNSWYWSPCGRDLGVSSDGASTCATAPGASGGGDSSGSVGPVEPPATGPRPAVTARPAPAQPPVPLAVVREGARPVLSALGLDVDRAQVSSGPYGGAAVLAPEVGGLPTSGLTTRVEVDAKGRPSSGSGALARLHRGASYPLISAQAAFAALPGAPRMLACPVDPDGKGCLSPAPPEVTGAHLGLSLQQLAAGDQLLVPSWLFDVRGSAEPLPAVAVAERYLATDQPTDLPGTPEPGASEPAPAREGVPLMGAGPAQDPNAVTVVYEDGGCGRDHVTPAVKEDAGQVVVLLQADVPPPDQMCTAHSAPTPVVVPLQAPLGNRTVIDATTGQPAPATG